VPAAWPSTLPPTFESDGYQETEPDVLSEDVMEVGPPKVRRRTTAAPAELSGSILCDQAQLATFKSFLRTTLAGGALPFSGFTHPSDQTSIPAARFKKGTVTYAARNPYVQIAFTLYVLP
jgi:hypothetical protein